MKNHKAIGKDAGTQSKNRTNFKNQTQEVEVLYQRLGNRWFAFSLIDNEVFFGTLPQEKSKSFSKRNKKLAGTS